MATPNRIREDARRAEEELQALALQAQQPPVDPNAPPAPPAPTSLDDVPPGEAPHPNAVAPPAPAGESGALTAEAYAELMQKYQTLQGLHNRDANKTAELQGRLDAMERMLAAYQAAKPTAPTPEEPVPSGPKLVTDAEVKEFGDDLIDVIRRTAQEATYASFHQILTQIQQLRTTVANLSSMTQSTATVVADTSERDFNNRLNQLVTDASGEPDWEALNTAHYRGDSSFVDWLAETGQDSDEPRQAVLVRAYQRKDADKCAGMFNAFKRAKGLAMGTGNNRPSVTPPPAPENPAAAFVSPAPVSNGLPSSQRGKGNQKVWKLSEINKIYEDYTKGHYKTDAQKAEYKRLTAEIDQATSEGRVTN